MLVDTVFCLFALITDLKEKFRCTRAKKNLTAVGFEPTQLALVELESTPLDHSGKLS